MTNFSVFLAASLLLAITPGPGLLYVLARSVANGRQDGLRSAAGTFFGGMFHVFAASIGLSALLAASAVAFSVVKYAGAGYLIFLGFRMILYREKEPVGLRRTDTSNALLQGVWTEVLNPKTALFFLSFIPQFVNVSKGHLFLQFFALGTVSVSLNTAADLVVVFLAAQIAGKLASSAKLRSRQRTASGLGMIGLGVYVAARD